MLFRHSANKITKEDDGEFRNAFTARDVKRYGTSNGSVACARKWTDKNNVLKNDELIILLCTDKTLRACMRLVLRRSFIVRQ